MEKLIAALVNQDSDMEVVLTKVTKNEVVSIYLSIHDKNGEVGEVCLNTLPNHINLANFGIGLINVASIGRFDSYVESVKKSDLTSSKENTKLEVYFDGSAQKGEYKGGVDVTQNNVSVGQYCERFYNAKSSNESEYNALLLALRKTIEHVKANPDRHFQYVIIFGDSQLVINQMTGKFKAKNLMMRSYRDKARKLEKELRSLLPKAVSFDYQWISREKNRTADKLSKS